ncbi:MAG: protoheme IX farnesyltransferase [Verrucomicrobia bacterium]|nr:MAG: protoheme IX farnesyltransferase [Verrucomicrobiota bacterium]
MKSLATSSVRLENIVQDLSLLVKARLSLMVVFTTFVGFLLGNRSGMEYVLLAATLIGTALSACGAAALNQWWERNFDARMPRTQSRPLPAGRLHPGDAFLLGLLFSVIGIAILALLVNLLSALLAALTILSYLFVYTPMKQRSSLNTLVGAIPGALPPLIGYAASQNRLGLEGWILFFILWFWQMPHFLAIAWMYRDQYADAGFIMLSKNDESGKMTSRQALIYSAFLLPISLLPTAVGLSNTFYAIAAFVLGLAFLMKSLAFVKQRSIGRARSLFFTSVIYLPLLLGVLLITRR